jgi:hypothetical protein
MLVTCFSTAAVADDFASKRAASSGDARDSVGECVNVADPLLEQVADALRAVADQVQGVILLVMAGEHWDTGRGKTSNLPSVRSRAIPSRR